MRHTTLRCTLALILAPWLAATAAAQTPLVAQASASGRLEGVVTDSLQDAPLAGAVVTAKPLDGSQGSSSTTTADQQGRYQFESLMAGRYAVTFESALLDSLEFGGAERTAEIRPGQTARADLAIPSSNTLRSLACPGTGLARGTGALLGVITDIETHKPLGGAELTVTWSEFAIDSAKNDVTSKTRVERVSSNTAGQYRMCGIPTDERLTIQVQHQGVSGAVRPITVDDDIGVLVRNMTFRVRAPDSTGEHLRVPEVVVQRDSVGRATLAGRITRADGQPIVGAQARLVGGIASVRSDEKGEFVLGGLPEGSQELEVRHLGYNLARRPIHLREGQIVRENVSLERVVSLDSVRVVAHRVKYPEFERNRLQYRYGTFMDADEIARRGRKTLPLLLSSTGDFRLMPMSRGRMSVQSQHLARCTQTQAGTERLDPLNLVVDNMEHMEFSDVYFPIVEAIEIYSEIDKAPMKYARACTVVVVWTKWSAKKPKAAPRDGTR